MSGLLQYLQTSENLKSQPTEHLETISIIGYWKIVHIFHIFYQNYIIFYQVISSSVLAQSSLFHNNWRENDIKYQLSKLLWQGRKLHHLKGYSKHVFCLDIPDLMLKYRKSWRWTLFRPCQYKSSWIVEIKNIKTRKNDLIFITASKNCLNINEADLWNCILIIL